MLCIKSSHLPVFCPELSIVSSSKGCKVQRSETSTSACFPGRVGSGILLYWNDEELPTGVEALNYANDGNDMERKKMEVVWIAKSTRAGWRPSRPG